MPRLRFFLVLSCFFATASFSYAQKTVYYSVGTETADLKSSGSLTVTISSGVATFSEPQADNIGVGDEITYGGAKAYISGRLSDTHYSVTTRIGDPPADVSVPTAVTSILRAFNSLAGAVAGASNGTHLGVTDLFSNGYQLHLACYDDDPMEDNAFAIDGYTTGVNHYIRVFTPTSPGQVGRSQRHTGVSGTGFRLRPVADLTSTLDFFYIHIFEEYVRIEGIEIDGSGLTNGQRLTGVMVDDTVSSTSNIRIDGLIIHDLINSNVDPLNDNDVYGFQLKNGNVKISNTIIYHLEQWSTNGSASVQAVHTVNNPTIYLFNNTIFNIKHYSGNGTSAGGIKAAGGSVIATNNVVLDVDSTSGAEPCFTGTMTQTNNVSSDDTGTIIGKTDYPSYFQDTTVLSEDLHLRNDSNKLWGSYGADLDTDPDLPVTRDIDGQSRHAAQPDIGADEFYCLCEPLTTSEGAGTLTITSLGSFKMVFNQGQGAALEEYYDLAEDPGLNLVGNPASDFYGLFHDSIVAGGILYTSGTNTNGAELQLLEATPTRARVRQENFFQRRPVLTDILSGLKGYGDYSIYPSGKMGLRWNRKTTASVASQEGHPLEISARKESLPDPRNDLTMYNQGGTTFPHIPGDDDFVLAKRDTAGARADILAIMHKDWPLATRLDADPAVAFFSWRDLNAGPLGAGLNELWNFLIYHKPDNFIDQLDPEVTGRRDDYRTADLLTVIGPGDGWNENTADADFFNESEGAYTFDFNMSLGLTFQMDGAGTNRFSPFFKIRGWRSIDDPSVTLQSIGLSNDRDFRADVKPFSRAYFAQDLMWSSTLQNAGAVTSPEVGTGGTVNNGDDFQPTPYGYGARFDTDGEYLTLPAAGNFDPNKGSIEFWYQPNYDFGSGDSLEDHGFFGYWIDNNNFFYALHQPYLVPDGSGEGIYLQVSAGGTISEAITGSGPLFPMLWRATDWVHLRFAWDVFTSRLEIYVNGDLRASAPYTAAPALPGDDIFYIGERNRNNNKINNATGIIDEFRIYSDPDLPQPVGYAGLTTSGNESLASTTNNFLLDFTTVDGNGRGEYAYFGADSKFRGLNISLATRGAGTVDLQWQYWNGTTGAWTNLEQVPFGFIDETNDLTTDGTIYWTIDPTNWSSYSVDGGPDLFYVRAFLASGLYAPAPVERIIKTDILLFQYCGHVTLDDQEFSFSVPKTTAVELQSLEAVGGDGTVELKWRTGSEIDNLGFHVYRSRVENGPYTRLTSRPIPGLGSSPVGASYRYLDENVTNGTLYYYELEDIETTGKTERHGPVSALPRAGDPDPSGNEPVDTPPQPGEGESSTEALITYGDVSLNSLQVLERGRYQVTLELRTEGFHAVPQEDGTVHLSVPGYVELSEEGSLSIPVKRYWVEALAGRNVELVSIQSSSVEAVNLRPSGAGGVEVAASRDGTVRLRRQSSSSTRQGDGSVLVPETSARLVSVAFQGETKKALVEMAPLRWDPIAEQILLAKRLIVILSFGIGDPAEVSRGGRRGRRPPHVESHFERPVAARLATTEPGLYALSFEDVFAGRRRGGGIDAGRLRLSRLGESVSFHIEPHPDRFETGSVLYFISEGASANPYGNEAVYELELGALGDAMLVRDASPTGAAATRFFWQRLERERNRLYQAALLEAPDVWLWDVLFAPAQNSYPFTVLSLAPVSENALLEIWLQGASNFAASPDHHVRIYVNQALVDEVSWDGKKPRTVEVPLYPGVLREGENLLEIENVGDTEAAYSMVFLDRFAVTYPKRTFVESGTLEGRWSEGGTAEITGFSATAHVLDVTDDRPQWLTNVESGADGTRRFQVQAGRAYFATEIVRSPGVQVAAPIRWKKTSHRADYLVIGPQAFLDVAQPLIQHRRADGLNVKAVAIEDVYAEFGFGETRPGSIHEFLSYAYHYWRAPSFRYVLLLGDASFDFKDYLETGVQNHVPPLMLKTSYLWTVSDPAYAAVNGEDLLPDVAIGRLPATSQDEVRSMVGKILAYETGAASLQASFVLVTDDPDSAGNFDENALELASTVLASRIPKTIRLSRLGAAATRTEILNAFDEGASLISYIGHGGIDLWASENLFDAAQVRNLSQQSQQPLVLTMNCLNGYFHFPYINSLAEELLKADGKGAIAAFSPSGLSLNSLAHQLHKAFLRELVGGDHQRLGDVVLKAQESFADTNSSIELLSIYHLLGDPGLRLR